MAPVLNCVSQLLKRLVITSPSCPLEYRDHGVDVFQLTEKSYYYGGLIEITNSNLEFLTYLKMSVVVVQNFNFLLRVPVLKCLIIESSTHQEAIRSKNWDDNEDKCEKLVCSREVGDRPLTHYICGNKLIRESNALGEGYLHLSLLQFQVDMHFNDVHLSLLQKWLPNVTRIA